MSATLEKISYMAPWYDAQRRRYEDRPTEGYVTVVPGLVVQRKFSDASADLPQWLVVHSRSGATAAAVDDPEAAMWIAARLGEIVTDWSKPAAEILTPEVKERCRAMLEEHRCRDFRAPIIRPERAAR